MHVFCLEKRASCLEDSCVISRMNGANRRKERHGLNDRQNEQNERQDTTQQNSEQKEQKKPNAIVVVRSLESPEEDLQVLQAGLLPSDRAG